MSFTLLGILNSQAAGGAGGDYELLETVSLASNTNTITFSGLGDYSDYKHLQIRYLARQSDSGVGSAYIDFRFNADSGSNYVRRLMWMTGSNVISQSTTSYNRIYRTAFVSGSSNTPGSFGQGVVDILDFSSNSKNKVTRTLTGILSSDLSVANYVGVGAGLWMNTNPITSITMLIENGARNFATGSRLSLYGSK